MSQSNPLLPQSEQPIWLSLGEASEILGVHQTTLRTWSDQGAVPVFRTPGGHRRFRLADLRAFLHERVEQAQTNSGMDQLMEHALGRVRQEISKVPAGWRTELTERDLESNRERGRRLFALAMNYVMRPEQREEIMADGQRLGQEYGREAALHQVSLVETGRAVQFFRRQLLDSVRREGDLDSGDMQIRQTIAHFLDEILYAVLEGYETAGQFEE